MPPGATHAVFSMRDANGFLIHSEDVPDVGEAGHHEKDSGLLKNGYAYKPGLFSLIKLGEIAFASTADAGLGAAIAAAKSTLEEESASEEQYCDAIRLLRAKLRKQKGTDEFAHPALNRFPTDPLF